MILMFKIPRSCWTNTHRNVAEGTGFSHEWPQVRGLGRSRGWYFGLEECWLRMRNTEYKEIITAIATTMLHQVILSGLELVMSAIHLAILMRQANILSPYIRRCDHTQAMSVRKSNITECDMSAPASAPHAYMPEYGFSSILCGRHLDEEACRLVGGGRRVSGKPRQWGSRRVSAKHRWDSS